MLPKRKRPVPFRTYVMTAEEASAVVEWLWAGFEHILSVRGLDTARCLCGCVFDPGMHLYGPEHDDDLIDEHLDMVTIDPEKVTRLENWWRHYARWGHDGRNPLGGKAVALPTWQGRP